MKIPAIGYGVPKSRFRSEQSQQIAGDSSAGGTGTEGAWASSITLIGQVSHPNGLGRDDLAGAPREAWEKI